MKIWDSVYIYYFGWALKRKKQMHTTPNKSKPPLLNNSCFYFQLRKISPGSFGETETSPNNRTPIFNRSLSSPSQMIKSPATVHTHINRISNLAVDPDVKTEPELLLKVSEDQLQPQPEVIDSAEDIMSTSRTTIEQEIDNNQSEGCIVS